MTSIRQRTIDKILLSSNLFRPWHWHRALLATGFLLLGVTYLLSYEPVDYFMYYFNAPDYSRDAVRIAYTPAIWCYNHSELAADVFRWESRILVSLFGPWNIPPAEY